jgi:DNA-binding response OmpR family regulator
MAEDLHDVALLDLWMPGMNGVTVMETIRAQWPETMVVVMTAYASLDSAIVAVRQGAFDYLRKPCRIEDVAAVVERAWQKKLAQGVGRGETAVSPLPTHLLHTGDLLINTAAHTVQKNQETITLTPTESTLLMLLAATPGQPVLLSVLITQGLGYTATDHQASELLRVHISRLRQKVGAHYIHTVRGGGYMLTLVPEPPGGRDPQQWRSDH